MTYRPLDRRVPRKPQQVQEATLKQRKPKPAKPEPVAEPFPVEYQILGSADQPPDDSFEMTPEISAGLDEVAGTLADYDPDADPAEETAVTATDETEETPGASADDDESEDLVA